MSVPYVTLGNVITLSTISASESFAYYELPIESEVIVEQAITALVEKE